MSKFKVGQEVRVVDDGEMFPSACSDWYDELKPQYKRMYIEDDENIQNGKYTIVQTIDDSDAGYICIISNNSQVYFIHEDGLKLVLNTHLSHPLVLSRDKLNDMLVSYLEGIKQKYLYKHSNYGADDDPLFNFRCAARNVLGEESAENMYKALMVYVEKHLAALRKNGLSDSEFNERFHDVIVYSLISMAMKETFDKEASND
jgi:hypothetical protein